jgi:hypothetical protein
MAKQTLPERRDEIGNDRFPGDLLSLNVRERQKVAAVPRVPGLERRDIGAAGYL